MLNISTLFASSHFRKSDIFRPIELIFNDHPAQYQLLHT